MTLLIVVEGQTEEAFVKTVLARHLDTRGVYTSATIVGKTIAQKRGHRRRGGGHSRHWQEAAMARPPHRTSGAGSQA